MRPGAGSGPVGATSGSGWHVPPSGVEPASAAGPDLTPDGAGSAAPPAATGGGEDTVPHAAVMRTSRQLAAPVITARRMAPPRFPDASGPPLTRETSDHSG